MTRDQTGFGDPTGPRGGLCFEKKKKALRLKVFTFRAFTRVSVSGCLLMPEISCSFNILDLFKVIFYFLPW